MTHMARFHRQQAAARARRDAKMRLRRRRESFPLFTYSGEVLEGYEHLIQGNMCAKKE